MAPPTPGALKTMAFLADGRTIRTVEAGEVIFQSGQEGHSMFGIVEGSVRLEWGGGRSAETLGPGSTFGVGALVDTQHHRYARATALEKTRLLEMNREEFLFALQELPMFGLEMLHDLEERLGHLQRSGGFSAPPPA
ncbi:MAG: cAMP-binding protein [Cyanobium sp. CACIAM 14]|nr:MAG: cAMP-binding protein [Cyanobium sp. CACIAM 14]